MENIPIKRPGKTYDEPDLDKTLDALFARANTQQTIRVWWEQIYEKLQEYDADIWLNIGKKYVGLYSPERSFASFKLSKTSLVFECFTRGQSMQGVKVASKKYSPRWGRFSVKHEDAIDFAIGNLIEAQARLKAAIKAGEQTSYYSGGQGFGKAPPENNVDEFNDENI